MGHIKGNHRVVWSNKAISLSRYLILRGKKKPSFRCKKRRKWRISSPTIRSPSLKKPSACSTRTATVWFSLFIISLLLALDFLIDLFFFPLFTKLLIFGTFLINYSSDLSYFQLIFDVWCDFVDSLIDVRLIGLYNWLNIRLMRFVFKKLHIVFVGFVCYALILFCTWKQSIPNQTRGCSSSVVVFFHY